MLLQPHPNPHNVTPHAWHCPVVLLLLLLLLVAESCCRFRRYRGKDYGSSEPGRWPILGLPPHKPLQAFDSATSETVAVISLGGMAPTPQKAEQQGPKDNTDSAGEVRGGLQLSCIGMNGSNAVCHSCLSVCLLYYGSTCVKLSECLVAKSCA